MKSTDLIKKSAFMHSASHLGTDERNINLHLTKQGVLEFTNIKELKFSALYVIERSTHP